jgi:hypothetical protein
MPFIELQGGVVFNDEIKENGGNTANLIIDKGTNGRFYGTFGINANYNINNVLVLHGGINGCSAILGEKGTINEVLAAEMEHSLEIESTKELFYFGIDLQLDYKIGDNFMLYFNGNYGTNSEYLMGFGISYRVLPAKIKS